MSEISLWGQINRLNDQVRATPYHASLVTTSRLRSISFNSDFKSRSAAITSSSLRALWLSNINRASVVSTVVSRCATAVSRASISAR
jgi:hypothetical protein